MIVVDCSWLLLLLPAGCFAVVGVVVAIVGVLLDVPVLVVAVVVIFTWKAS